MKTLYLLRHAKSSWKNEELPDFDRPLTRRGRRSAESVGQFLRTEKIDLDLVLSSPAIRARQTIDKVLRTSGLRPELRYDERIYEATGARLLAVLSQIENEHKTVLLVGHNPGMEELLLLLTGKTEQFPTAALAKVGLKISKWAAVEKKKATLEWLVTPREL